MATLLGYETKAIESAWNAGNDAGNGFSWTSDLRRGLSRWGRTDDSDSGITVFRRLDGSLVGVSDEGWAVALDLRGAERIGSGS